MQKRFGNIDYTPFATDTNRDNMENRVGDKMMISYNMYKLNSIRARFKSNEPELMRII